MLKYKFYNVSVFGEFPDGNQMQLLLNVGGPDRVSRVQMAEAVASARGYNPSLIKPVSASSVRLSSGFINYGLPSLTQ